MSGRRNSSIRSKVINILVTGYKKMKDLQKHQVFVMEVTWNNGERYEIYRRYSDIFSFHTALKEFFPIAAGRGDEDRIIPLLPKINFVPVLRSQVTRVTQAKLEQYNLYCRTIISMDPSISEHVHVVGFFSPRGEDRELPMLQFRRPVSATLQSFGEAAVSTSLDLNGEEEAVSNQLQPPAAAAVMTKNGGDLEEHVALADFAAEDASQVSFKRGDQVFVKTRDESGWWLCKVNGQTGWAPPTFLKKKEAEVIIRVDSVETELEESADSDGYIKVQPSFKRIVLPVVENYQGSVATAASFGSTEKGSPDHTALQEVEEEVTAEEYITIESYQADGPGQVSFKEGEKVIVLEKLEDGWWFVTIGDQQGWAPCSYLEKLNWEDEEEEETVTILDTIEKYYAVDDYEAVEEDEISFPEGAVVDVIQKRFDGWWVVRYEDKTGLAPGTFLRKAQPDLPIISEDQEIDSFPAPDSSRRAALSYENVQLQMMRAQPPRRKSMRQWVKSKNRAPAVLPRQNTPPKRAADSGRHVSHQSHLGALAIPEGKQYQPQGSIREVLRGKGGVKNKVNTFERTDSEVDLIQGQLPIMMMKPGMPRARIRKEKTAQTGRGGGGGGDKGLGAAATSQQAQPKIKPRTKIQKKSSNGPGPAAVVIDDDPPPPPLPPKSPTHVTSSMRKSPAPHATSPMRTRANERQVADRPPPLGPGHPSRNDTPPVVRSRSGHLSHDRSHDQRPPPLGPGHPLRPDPDDVELPHNPPRPTLSVIQRARREKSPRLAVPPRPEDIDSIHDSSDTLSSKSFPRSRPKQKIKKTRSHTAADERFQSARPSRDHQPATRYGSAKVSNREDVYLTPPQNGEVGEASGGGGGGIPFSDDFTAMLIKHILDSNNPSLKAKLKNMLENSDETRNSLTDILQ